MKKIIVVIFIFYIVVILFSDSSVKFDKLEYNFGRIKEEKGPYEHIFYFTNVSDKPLKLTKLKASCGCTATGWSTGIIKPKERGFVKVIYNTNNRPGTFKKNILVYNNLDKNPTTLSIKGFVIGTPGKFYSKLSIGNLQFDKSYLNLKKINQCEIKKQIVHLYNNGSNILKIKIKELPEYIHVKLAKNTLKSKEKTTMEITIDSSKLKKEFGHFRIPITFILNSREQHGKFFVKFYRYFDFSNINKNKIPYIVLVNKQTSFSYYKNNKKTFDQLIFKNMGKSDLIIFNIRSSKNITIKDFTKKLKPNQIGKVIFRIENKEKLNSFRGYIKIYSNDPSHFETILTIFGKEKQNKKLTQNIKHYPFVAMDTFIKYQDNLLQLPIIKDEFKNISKVIIVDVRDEKSYNKEHFKNSINLPLIENRFKLSLKNLDKKDNILYVIIAKDYKQANEAAFEMANSEFRNIICIKEK